jgi:HK97 family phage major capsid protein
LLNGDGLDGDLLGIRNRSNLTPLLTRTGSENVMDAIHRQITQIMINSFVMPDAIVMNPLDWEVAALTKETGTGAYVGANPFAPVLTRTMWGLPVVVTQRMPQGRALPGAFSTMAQFFAKGGVAVDMSNSHEDFFTHNKVAIRAEERGALAVYRPGAFGEVDLGTGESESETP